MTRGTTPTHIFLLPENLNPNLFTEIFITYSQIDRVVTEKKMDDLTILGNEVRVTLTQEDTLKFLPGRVEIQMRAKTALGDAYASNIITLPAQRILKDGVI